MESLSFFVTGFFFQRDTVDEFILGLLIAASPTGNWF